MKVQVKEVYERTKDTNLNYKNKIEGELKRMNSEAE